MENNKHMKNLKKEKGSIIMEAAMALPIFMFTIVTILSFVNICSAQTLITNTVNGVAADFGKISYLYCKLGVYDAKSGVNNQASDANQVGTTLMNMDFGSFESIYTSLESCAGIINESDDFAGSLLALVKSVAIDGLEQVIGSELISALAKARMEKEDASADELLKHYGIQDGMDGIDWFLTFDTSTDEVLVMACYKVRVLDFFGLEYDYEFSKLSRTVVWNPSTSYASDSDE